MATATGTVSISKLLKKLSTLESASTVSAEEIAAAVALVFENKLSQVQFALLLWALHTTGLDHKADVLAGCATSMREVAAQPDKASLETVVKAKAKAEGQYEGGLCDIVGTGGDGHNTFNISTTSSIIASAQILVAKHGNNSSTSLSGSADLLQHAPQAPIFDAVVAANIAEIYKRTNYAFLYAPQWHPAMKYSAATRKEVPVRTIFNLLGPLANPVHNTGLVEARILGVARKDIGQNFADALQLSGAKKALVVCGDENLDELSCAGTTHCWYIHETGNTDADGARQTAIERMTLTPEDFGLPRHALSEVSGGKGPSENAEILMRILSGQMPDDDPVLHFVLLNTAALLTVSGICEADVSNMGDGDDGQVIKERGPGGLRWKEGVRRARWSIKSQSALRQWEDFVSVTKDLASR